MKFPIEILHKGLHMSLDSVKRRKISCKNVGCYSEKGTCSYKNKSNIQRRNDYLCFTEAIFTVTNPYHAERSFGYSCFTLVDTNLFSYQAIDLCNEVESNSRLQYTHFNIPSQSKAKICVFFPELEEGEEASKILFKFRFYKNEYEEDTISFEIINSNSEELSTLEQMIEKSLLDSLMRGMEEIQSNIYKLEKTILSKREKIAIINKIFEMGEKIKNRAEELKEETREEILSKLKEIIEPYETNKIPTNPFPLENSKFGEREDLGANEYRSSWEANIARILKNKKIEFEYEKQHYDLSELSYFPDFFIGEDTIIEVKGAWDNESITKVDEFARSGRVKNYLIVDSDMYYDINMIYSNYKMLPNWEETPIQKGKGESIAIVGMKFSPDQDAIKQLQIGQSLIIEREPNNPYDSFAIVVKDIDGHIIGHFAKKVAFIYSQKLQLGMTFDVNITSIQDTVIKAKVKRNNFETLVIHELLK